ncbi:MAG: glucose-6-phosphate isomerase [Bacillota bacterium]|nr:glucose-6-phosphate isomerase [Bacillota bacterium]
MEEKRESLRLSLADSLVTEQETGLWQEALGAARERLNSGREEFTGWVRLPLEYDRAELEALLAAAERIRRQCQVLVVIGIGGSYLGARAGLEMLSHSFRRELFPRDGEDWPVVYFAGHNISGTYHRELLELIEEKEVCLCVISKSGVTAEPAIAFALLKEALCRKYGAAEAGERIYAITDRERGVLRQEADREGYVSFVVPDDIGGRYSVLTPVGLLPMAAAGLDVKAMLEGAASALALEEDCGRYAAARNALFRRGKCIEVFESYEPKLAYFAEWLKQLFGESEGKEEKGIFPASLQFSTDLHSMGQFLQEGNPVFFETVLCVEEPERDLKVPESAGGLFAGKSLNTVNRAALEGVAAAHKAAGRPIVRIEIPALTPYYFGQMVHFFETSCALSAYLMGVDPFNQPGVEQYKKEMRAQLAE